LTSIFEAINLYSTFTLHITQRGENNVTYKQATLAVRSGLNDDEQYGCVVPPIHLSSTYNFTDFNEPRAHDYSRRGNPTRDVVQRALAELEGGRWRSHD
jgi:cystathionine gamma-synthase